MRAPLILFAALAASSVALGARAQADGDPRGFLEDAIRANNAEMLLGKLAASHGTDPRVRDFGRMLYDDHMHAREQAVALAHQVGAEITERAEPAAIAEQDKLEQTYGRAFDREFVRFMIVEHRKDIAEFQDAAQRGGPAGQYAADTLPDLQKHLHMAARLDPRVG